MAQFMVFWDAGYGESYDVSDADDYDGAVDEAYERWNEEVQSNASYHAREIDIALCAEYGLDPVEYDLMPTIEECEEHGWEPEDFGYGED